MTLRPPIVRRLGRLDYPRAEPMMRAFTAARGADTPDEIWLVEHPPVYTLGRAARSAHVHAPGDIGVVRTERGGQVTYHGPGQAICYLLVDLRRGGLRVRDFIDRIEAATIALLAAYGIDAMRRAGAPGVYVRGAGRRPDAGRRQARRRPGETATDAGGAADHERVTAMGAKIASIGVRITEGRSWHGVALNVSMDLEPFSRIDPCGYPGLVVTDMRSCLGSPPDPDEVGDRFAAGLAAAFTFDSTPRASARTR